MLALFNKHQSPPDGMQALGSLYVDKAQEPLAFIPMNEEEQVRHDCPWDTDLRGHIYCSCNIAEENFLGLYV